MRLSSKEIENLKKTLESIDCNAKLYLFGSRTNNSKKGGDIDLLIISETMTKKELRSIRINFFNEFGEQKLDIILDDGTLKDPFCKLIFKDAIEL
ncbi:MAG: nucleotidyltransferase domain-containing protein [Spirochaetales bacterium]|nr:nucleotidyltransferase domain-containing protein [Spirochaetales bacterium]